MKIIYYTYPKSPEREDNKPSPGTSSGTAQNNAEQPKGPNISAKSTNFTHRVMNRALKKGVLLLCQDKKFGKNGPVSADLIKQSTRAAFLSLIEDTRHNPELKRKLIHKLEHYEKHNVILLDSEIAKSTSDNKCTDSTNEKQDK